jgi:lipid-binding SYLF domain-containing protein
MFVLKGGVAQSVINERRRQNMFQYLHLVGPVGLYGLLALTLLRPLPALAASAAEIDREVDDAMQTLYNSVPVAPTLVVQACGILIFPKIVKGGFLVGGEYGEGALRLGGQTVGYYNIAAVSYGLQAGLQDFGYALVFMTDAALQYLDRSEGFEIGVGPSIVVVDEGVAKTLTTTTAREDVYAFVFGQEGLMGGLGLQGSKITRIAR